jgi:hypothetical protein
MVREKEAKNLGESFFYSRKMRLFRRISNFGNLIRSKSLQMVAVTCCQAVKVFKVRISTSFQYNRLTFGICRMKAREEFVSGSHEIRYRCCQ